MQRPTTEELAGVWRLAREAWAVLDPVDHTFLGANLAWTHLLGWTVADLTGTAWPELVHADDRHRVLAELAGVSSGTTLDASARVRTALDEHRLLHWRAQVVPGTGRILLGVTVPADDAGLEEQLRGIEERFQLAMNSAPIGMAISRLDGPWVAVNPALCRLLGVSEDELLGGLSFAELTHPQDLPAERALLDEMLAGARSSYTIDKRYVRPDGSVVWTQTVVALVRDEEGRPRYFVAQCLDTTEQQRITAQLRDTADRLRVSDEVRVAFLRATSHELRTPLTVVAGLTDTLRRRHRDLPADDVDQLLERVGRNADRLMQLIEDLLDVDRLSSGLVRADQRPVALHELVEDMTQRSDLEGRSLETDLEPVTITGDRAKLERVVSNLVANASRHCRPEGQVRVALRTRENAAVLRVEDDGEGIPPGYEERIFEPFVQGPDRHHAASPGTGLGLTLSQQFVELHGGTITASNRPEGGARFEVVLPTGAPITG